MSAVRGMSNSDYLAQWNWSGFWSKRGLRQKHGFQNKLEINIWHLWCDQHAFHAALKLRQGTVEEYGSIQIGNRAGIAQIALADDYY